ncbi:MAG: M15 family metallopeptidase [Prochlorotrichaceae cyanobacterium]
MVKKQDEDTPILSYRLRNSLKSLLPAITPEEDSLSPKQPTRIVPSASSGDSTDDIPFALRDPLDSYAAPPTTARFSPPWWFLGIIVVIALATFASALWIFNLRPQDRPTASESAGSEESALPSDTVENPTEENLLGHRPYAEADPSTLVAIDDREELLLREAAADAFIRMRDAARLDGVSLMPLSAYRSIEDQQYLFFDVKSIRGQDASTRAEVSAPPGYSEHHTGYAVDIGDATAPETNLSGSFEETAAFQWLQENASYYSFELSFLPENEQGIAYEPWHWRYVGDQDSLETFYKGTANPASEPLEPEESDRFEN